MNPVKKALIQLSIWLTVFLNIWLTPYLIFHFADISNIWFMVGIWVNVQIFNVLFYFIMRRMLHDMIFN